MRNIVFAHPFLQRLKLHQLALIAVILAGFTAAPMPTLASDPGDVEADLVYDIDGDPPQSCGWDSYVIGAALEPSPGSSVELANQLYEEDLARFEDVCECLYQVTQWHIVDAEPHVAICDAPTDEDGDAAGCESVEFPTWYSSVRVATFACYSGLPKPSTEPNIAQ